MLKKLKLVIEKMQPFTLVRSLINIDSFSQIKSNVCS